LPPVTKSRNPTDRDRKDHQTRVNEQIRITPIRLIGAAGEQVGVVPTADALNMAREAQLDLVEVAALEKPPVCKIMDYGRFKYEEKKKANDAKKKQIVIKVKEVKLRPKTEEHDYDFKIRNVKSFIEEGHKAKITIMFRGREITHREIGQAILSRIAQDLKDIAVVEQSPRMEGRLLFMILAANPRWLQSQRAKAASAPAAQSARPPRPPQPAGQPPAQAAQPPPAAAAHAEGPKA